MNVSVIIPTYNGKALLEKHLPSVISSLQTEDEIIIVDDASTDESVSWLTEEFSLQSASSTVPDTTLFLGAYKKIDLKVLINGSNQRFSSSCNRGVLSAKHEIIVLLNNDVSPRKDFLPPLIAHFDDQQVFAVGCKEIATHEGNKEYGRSEAHFERGYYVHARASDQNGTDTAWVSGGSGAFRKSMWEKLSGFDLDYRPAYQEDIDLSYRARLKGWKVLFEPKSVVYHNHESTNASVFGKNQMEIMSFKNGLLFMWKNAKGMELLKHFFWLPYHVVFTTLRSRGLFLQGFIQALKTLLR